MQNIPQGVLFFTVVKLAVSRLVSFRQVFPAARDAQGAQARNERERHVVSVGL